MSRTRSFTRNHLGCHSSASAWQGRDPWHIPRLIPVSMHQGLVVQSSRQAAASAHSRGPAPLLTPFSLLPCLSFGPGGLAAGLAASTRNPGRGKQTKHRLSPGSRRASARLWSSFLSWMAQSHREKPLQLGIASHPMSATSANPERLGLHTWTQLLP